MITVHEWVSWQPTEEEIRDETKEWTDERKKEHDEKIKDLFSDFTDYEIGALLVDLVGELSTRNPRRAYATLETCMEYVKTDIARRIMKQLRDHLNERVDLNED